MTSIRRLVHTTFVAVLVAASIPVALPAVTGAAVPPPPHASTPPDRIAVAERPFVGGSGVPQRIGAV